MLSLNMKKYKFMFLPTTRIVHRLLPFFHLPGQIIHILPNSYSQRKNRNK